MLRLTLSLFSRCNIHVYICIIHNEHIHYVRVPPPKPSYIYIYIYINMYIYVYICMYVYVYVCIEYDEYMQVYFARYHVCVDTQSIRLCTGLTSFCPPTCTYKHINIQTYNQHINYRVTVLEYRSKPAKEPQTTPPRVPYVQVLTSCRCHPLRVCHQTSCRN
jgi:hypothetical protein